MRAALLLALAAGAGALTAGRQGDGSPAAEGRLGADEAREGLERPRGDFAIAGEWPFHDSSSMVDVWLWMMNERKLSSMYDPVFWTLGEALHGAGANVALVWESNSKDMIRNVTASLDRGRTPLIVTIAHYYANVNGGQKILQRCGDLGAFVVLYQTEPVEREAHLGDMVDRFKPKEIWDYSRRNLDWYPESAKSLYRYMPPGYAWGLDFGVEAVSPSHAARIARTASKLGFLGGWHFRENATTDLYHKVLEERIVSREDIWTKDDTIEFLTDYPLQLNTHKLENCCPSTNPVEALRMAQILSNRACVVSAHSDPRDEAEWEGIVHFEEGSRMGQLVEDVGRDVRACQLASFEAFKSRFEPAAILRRSGFLSAWQPMPRAPAEVPREGWED